MRITDIKTFLVDATPPGGWGGGGRNWLFVKVDTDEGISGIGEASGWPRVIETAGFGDRFVHRTGHSIDRELHGSGPHLDDYETHDDRQLVPGVGFSVEPGVYLPGEFGVRSEVNVHWAAAGPEVTPRVPQSELIVAAG